MTHGRSPHHPAARCRSQRSGEEHAASAETGAGAQDFRRFGVLRGACWFGMLQLAVGCGALASARLLSGSAMPKKAGATSKASGKSRGVEWVGHGLPGGGE